MDKKEGGRGRERWWGWRGEGERKREPRNKTKKAYDNINWQNKILKEQEI